MNLAETLKLAFSSLAANLLRSLLTICGVTIGVFSVIAVMTVISAMSAYIETTLTVLGTNSFQVTKYPPLNFTDPRSRFRNRRDITYPVAQRFKELMGDSARISLMLTRWGGQVASYKDRRTNPSTTLRGADENFITAFDFAIAQGRNLAPDDIALSRPVCVIGEDIRAKLFPDNENPLGALIRVGSQTCTVIGVTAPKGSTMGQSRDAYVLVPITRWLAAFGNARRSVSINVQSPGMAAFAATQDRAIGMMRLARGLAPEDPNDFEIFSNDSLIETTKKVTDKIALGALVISAIALLAAGVGVMNIMLVSVTERTKEIGVRKSIGARKSNILAQFLMEAAVLSLIGGVCGILLGALLGNTLLLLIGGSVSFPWDWAFLAIFVCGLIGVGFGMYPAWKAASLDPIEALRHE
jgi:putative ABC transport system permease protein